MEKLKGQLESYKSQPFSLVLRLLMWIATFLTVGITVCIVGYILIRGIPNLSPEMFAWEYNTENVSMMPAIINTVLIWDYLPMVHGQTLGTATGLYSLVAGFALSILCIVIFSLCTKEPSQEILAEFYEVKNWKE